jgi:hypothetical protein
MAQLRLGRYEAEEGELPSVCMRCGAPATATKSKQFSWHPQWVLVLILAGLLPWAIVALILTKRMRVRVPLCQKHKNHWLWRGWVIYGGLAAIFVLGIGLAILTAQLEGAAHGRGSDLGGFLCMGGWGVALAWLITAAIVQATGIRPTEITDRSITLNKVSPVFVEAVRKERLSTVEEVYEENDRPRPRRPARDEFYDPKAGRGKQSDSESFEEDEKGQ